jgi:hypothetical protein
MDHVDNLVALEIDNDRPISAALQPAPVVDPDDPQRLFRRGRVTLEIAQNPVITVRQAEAAHQAFSRTPTRNISDRPREIRNTTYFPGPGCENLIWLANKCFPLTQSVATSPSGHVHLQLDGRALDG